MSDNKNVSELNADALEALELLRTAIEELMQVAESVPDAPTKTAQLKEISRTIQQLENSKVLVPDELRSLRTSLLAELRPAEEARDAVLELREPFEETRRLWEGLAKPDSAKKREPRRRGPRRPSRRPRDIVFKGERYLVRTWQDVLCRLCALVLSGDPEKVATAIRMRGGKRPLFGLTAKGMTCPKRIEGTNLFVECNWSADSVVLKCKQVLSHFGLDDQDLEIRTDDAAS